MPTNWKFYWQYWVTGLNVACCSKRVWKTGTESMNNFSCHLYFVVNYSLSYGYLLHRKPMDSQSIKYIWLYVPLYKFLTLNHLMLWVCPLFCEVEVVWPMNKILFRVCHCGEYSDPVTPLMFPFFFKKKNERDSLIASLMMTPLCRWHPQKITTQDSRAL